jgi:hypothetical protein
VHANLNILWALRLSLAAAPVGKFVALQLGYFSNTQHVTAYSGKNDLKMI